jgi:dihydroneopterin aldolase
VISGPGKVKITSMNVFAYHGCTEEEKERGQTFLIDIELEHDFGDAVKNDDLELTIDYDRLISEVHEIASKERYDLIETLAARIGDHLMANTAASRALVRVRKPDAPLAHAVGEVSVEMAFGHE